MKRYLKKTGGIRVKNVNYLTQRLDFKEWISATKTRNYLIEDPILDYLEIYGKNKGYKKDYEREYFDESLNFSKYIMEKGIEFEDKIVELLKDKFSGKFLQISHNDKKDSLSVDLYNKTKKAINEKVPLIIHPVFHDEETKTFGIPDLLIRSEYIQNISNDTLIHPDQEYAIIDIKFTTLHFNVNHSTLRNSSNTKAFKGQIAVYNKILGKIMKTPPPSYGYILGRKSNITKGAFDKLGVIDFSGFDKQFNELSYLAIEWYKKIMNDKYVKVYPNMSNANDLPWHYAKKEIATKTGEITQLLHIGPMVRDKLIVQGLKNIQDITIKNIPFKGKRRNLLDEMLSINNSNELTRGTIKVPNDNLFYVDFETVSDINDTFEKLPEAGGNSMIYMIGCGYIVNNRWCFKNFTVDTLEPENEIKIVNEWINFMGNRPNIIHWSTIEESLIKGIKKKLERENPWFEDMNFINLHKLFIDTPIVIKGLYNYKLKNVAKTLFNLNLIKTEWGNNSTVDGIGSIVAAIKCDTIAKEQNISMKSIPIFSEIEYYNEIDCKVMYDIINVFKENEANKVHCHLKVEFDR